MSSALEPVFLATTALEDFWDTSKAIVFLGECCTLYTRQNFINTLNCQGIIPSWYSRNKLQETIDYINPVKSISKMRKLL